MPCAVHVTLCCPRLCLQEELAQLKPGERIERVTPLPPPLQSSQRSYGQQAVGKLLQPDASGTSPGGAAAAGGGGGGGSSSR